MRLWFGGEPLITHPGLVLDESIVQLMPGPPGKLSATLSPTASISPVFMRWTTKPTCEPSLTLTASAIFVIVNVVGPGVEPQYLPPVFKLTGGLLPAPPQTIISPPSHTAVGEVRPAGASVGLVAIQPSVLGLYLPPVFK